MELRSRVAVAVAGSCSSNLTPSLGTSICHGCGPKKSKRPKKKKGRANCFCWRTFKLGICGRGNLSVVERTESQARKSVAARIYETFSVLF